eukprot:g16787.t1
MAIPIVSGKDFLIIREAVGPALLVPWDQLAGELHMLLANFRPDRALEVELAPYRPSSKAQHLGVAFPVFGGLHWCGSVNRYPGFNRQLAESRKSDNYFNKIFMMLAIAEHQGFEWIVSVDDDVFLPPFSFMSLVRSGPMADKRQFCRDGSLMHCCRGGEAVDAKEIPAVPIPEPWNEVEWYNSRLRRERKADEKVERFNRMMDLSRAVLERMTKAQVSPDSFSYLWMIKVSGRRGGKAAEACLEEARHQELKLDTGMYNAVFRAYLAEEETPETPKNVKRLFEQMELDEIRADGMSLSSLAYAYAMQNEVERAEDLIFQARRESGRQRPEFFACLLFAYARKRGSRSRKAERAFRDLVDSGLAPTPAMLRYLRMAMPTEAEQLMAELGVSEKSVCVGGGKSW